MKRNIIGFLCLLLAMALVFVLTPVIQRGSSKRTTVVQVTDKLTEGTMLTVENTKLVEVGTIGLASSAIRDQNSVIGTYANGTIYPDIPLLPSMITTEKWNENAVLENLDDGHVAISVSAPGLAGTVSGKIHNGDIISIIVLDKKGTYVPDGLRYMKVIGMNDSEGTSVESGAPATLTFYVTPYQANLLVYYMNNTSLYFTLVCRESNAERAEELLARQDAVLEKIEEEEVKTADESAGTITEVDTSKTEATEPAAKEGGSNAG